MQAKTNKQINKQENNCKFFSNEQLLIQFVPMDVSYVVQVLNSELYSVISISRLLLVVIPNMESTYDKHSYVTSEFRDMLKTRKSEFKCQQICRAH